jgi:prepilin-type processing-associated H-X9-DG protein
MGNVNYRHSTQQDIPRSYVCNGGGGTTSHFSANSRVPMGVYSSRTTEEAKSSSNLILFAENRVRRDPEFWSGYGSTDNLHWALMNHGGMTNFAFADGHVDPMRPLGTVSGGKCMWDMDYGTPPAEMIEYMTYAQDHLDD